MATFIYVQLSCKIKPSSLKTVGKIKQTTRGTLESVSLTLERSFIELLHIVTYVQF